MSELVEIAERFAEQPLVVLGDLVADEYLYGTTSRISREAPVLIVREEGREIRSGGAANVAANLRALGGAPRLVGLVGDDPSGAELLEALARRGVDCAGLVVDADRFTTTKTRVVAGGRNTVRQQMLRIDRLNQRPVGAAIGCELRGRLARALDGAVGLLVSDYGEGVVEAGLIEAVAETVAAGLPVFVDSRSRISAFGRAATLTPNEPELAAATGLELDGPEVLELAGRRLLERTGAGAVLVKRGRWGMALFLPGRPTARVEAFGSDEVADVTGAGDTVLAAWSLAFVAGAGPLAAMQLANAAGGLKVQKAGTAVVDRAELIAALSAAAAARR